MNCNNLYNGALLPELKNYSLEDKINLKSRKLLFDYKQKNELSAPLFNIAIDIMLGDGSIQSQDKGKTYRLKLEQGD